jgi:ABC-type branched-subunit amino acid transport system ATPase component
MRVETDGLEKRFGGVVALSDVTLDFPAGSVTAIIGPNGAGKTTLFNVMAGFLKPDSGSVFLVHNGDGGRADSKTDILGLLPYQIALQGVGVLFQDVRIFDKLTALENVAVGAKNQPGENPLNCFFRPTLVASREKEVLEKARYYLDYVGLADKAHLWAKQLSYGQQKLMAIARLLAGDARVLLLDEPTSGVHPDMIEKLLGLIQQLADDDGRVVIMIEHNLNVVKRVGDWVYLMAGGRIEVFGKPDEVLRDSTLLEVFPTL